MKIKYTYGKITKQNNQYLLLELFDKNNICVYKVNFPSNELDVILSMNKNIINNEIRK